MQRGEGRRQEPRNLEGGGATREKEDKPGGEDGEKTWDSFRWFEGSNSSTTCRVTWPVVHLRMKTKIESVSVNYKGTESKEDPFVLSHQRNGKM